jgi:SAM-dependent methyltransferase
MIRALLPDGRTGIVGDWRRLPLAPGSITTILADGALACLPYPDGYATLATELARVLVTGGRFITRVYARPEPAAREPLAAIAPASARSIHALKWRVAMAAEHPTNLPVAQILAAFDALVPDRAALPYPRAAVAMLDNYATSPLVYSFPTLAEIIAPFAARFAARVLPTPTATYELADRCPTIVFTASAAP